MLERDLKTDKTSCLRWTSYIGYSFKLRNIFDRLMALFEILGHRFQTIEDYPVHMQFSVKIFFRNSSMNYKKSMRSWGDYNEHTM